MKLVDASDLAERLFVCRRTVVSAAERVGGVVRIGNKAFVREDLLKSALGDRYDCLAPDAIGGVPVRGKHRTLGEVAVMLGCSRSTVLRVIERTGLGVIVGNRRYVPESQIGSIQKNILSRGVTTLHKDKAALSERGKRMARSRWGK
jgi:hypothetical protein